MPKMTFSSRVAACAAVLLMVSACSDVPKYKRSSGNFDEWGEFEGKRFYPSTGTVAAIDPVANTITIVHGKDTKVYPVTKHTRIIREGTDIPLAQLPLKEQVKYLLSDDGAELESVWFGKELFTYQGTRARRRSGSSSSR
jgi:hypothetical protein